MSFVLFLSVCFYISKKLKCWFLINVFVLFCERIQRSCCSLETLGMAIYHDCITTRMQLIEKEVKFDISSVVTWFSWSKPYSFGITQELISTLQAYNVYCNTMLEGYNIQSIQPMCLSTGKPVIAQLNTWSNVSVWGTAHILSHLYTRANTAN